MGFLVWCWVVGVIWFLCCVKILKDIKKSRLLFLILVLGVENVFKYRKLLNKILIYFVIRLIFCFNFLNFIC